MKSEPGHGARTWESTVSRSPTLRKSGAGWWPWWWCTVLETTRTGGPTTSRESQSDGSDAAGGDETDTDDTGERDTEADSAAPMPGGLRYIYRRDRVQGERSGVTF